MMEYKGYLGEVEFDADAGLFHGLVLHTRDVITFQGTSVRELKKAFEDSIDDYLDFCRERGEEPDKPFSGQFVLRVNPELHRELNFVSSKAGLSLNAWVSERLAEAVASSKTSSARPRRRRTKS